jgi:peptidoglycan-N-acetylglucosamine deacetylase
MAEARILLTFDDGPHGGALGGSNRTEKVLDALKSRRATAAFFIQTHVPYRLASPNGLRIASRAHAEGHVLAVHTGSLADHRCHKWRCAQPADMTGTINGLDSDMARAKAAIRDITGADPRFVRATYGYTDDNCMNVYSRNYLKHVYWDIPGDDSGGASVASVLARLVAQTKRLATDSVELIYLLHDITEVTGEHLADFIDAIAAAVRANGHTPRFVTAAAEAASLMERKSRKGADLPCPADSMA